MTDFYAFAEAQAILVRCATYLVVSLLLLLLQICFVTSLLLSVTSLLFIYKSVLSCIYY